MQQTEKYKLNLIDPSDEFSPEPLNQNAETVEAQFQAREAAEKALDDKFTTADAAIQKNLGSGGSNARIAWGSYEGSGQCGKDHPNRLEFDFKPCLLFVHGYAWMVRPSGYSSAGTVTWGEQDVSWWSSATGSQCSNSNMTYYYMAVGVSL